MAEVPVRLNLGCDWEHMEGWVNVDVSPKCQPDLLADVTRLPLPDACADEVWASHILEHVPCWVDALGEWARVLKPGGIITVCVPDLMAGLSRYLSGEIDLRVFNATIFGGQQIGFREEFEHQQVFCASMLRDRMLPHFPDVQLVRYGTVRDAFAGEAMAVGHKPIEGGE